MCKTYTYFIEISDLLVGANFHIYFKVKGKRYFIYFDAGAWWLKSEDGLLSKLSYFVIDGNTASVTTYNKLETKDWRLVNPR
ncbi:MAG: hypothetical protein RXR43_15510 [Sulfolobus sp.]